MLRTSKKATIADEKSAATTSEVREEPVADSAAIDLDTEAEVPDDNSGSYSASEGEEGMDSGSGSGSDASMDTDTEIALAQQPTKSKQTLKRKRRAIPTSSFGQALNALLDTSTPAPKSAATRASAPGADSSTALLALKKNTRAKKELVEERLEAKARKAQLGERKEREERNRVRDVIGGWGGESERALRKVAQRGVVKLFNVIQQAQQSSSQAVNESTATRGTGKASLPAPSAEGFGAAGENKRKQKGSKKDNAIGRAKPVVLGQEDFLQSIRAGGLVSKV